MMYSAAVFGATRPGSDSASTTRTCSRAALSRSMPPGAEASSRISVSASCWASTGAPMTRAGTVLKMMSQPARDLAVRERLGAERARKHQVALLPRRDENVRPHRVQEQRQVFPDAAEARDEARSAVDRARVLADRRGDRALRRRDRVADRKLLAPVIILGSISFQIADDAVSFWIIPP